MFNGACKNSVNMSIVSSDNANIIYRKLCTCMFVMPVCSCQDGVCSPEDVDTVMTQALGLRYSLIGPFETMHLNASGGSIIYLANKQANQWQIIIFICPGWLPVRNYIH